MNYLKDPKLLATIEKLREVRVKQEIKMPANSFLRTHLANGKPLTLRNYQLQGILHLLAIPRFVLGDDTGLGKTIQTIASLCYVWEKRPDMPIIICSGFNKKINSEIVREMGVRKYLEKPIEMKTFARSIRDVLDGN